MEPRPGGSNNNPRHSQTQDGTFLIFNRFSPSAAEQIDFLLITTDGVTLIEGMGRHMPTGSWVILRYFSWFMGGVPRGFARVMGQLYFPRRGYATIKERLKGGIEIRKYAYF